WKWILVPALPAVALIAVGIWYLQRDTPEKAEKLLAQAYTEQRTMEMRWPGAEWGPMRETRGFGDSRCSSPDSFRVGAQMGGKHNPVITSDGGWLRTKAEIEILNGTPETAITTLLPALEAHPNSTPLTFDFAIAFFQRAVRTGSREDLDRSIGLLSNLVKRDP